MGPAHSPSHPTSPIVVAGEQVSCATSPSTGVVQCWGDVDATKVPDELKDTVWAALSAAGLFTCGVTAETHTLRCWGVTYDFLPVAEFGAWADVSASSDGVCAIQFGTGLLTCWGDPAYPPDILPLTEQTYPVQPHGPKCQ